MISSSKYHICMKKTPVFVPFMMSIQFQKPVLVKWNYSREKKVSYEASTWFTRNQILANI